MRWFVVYPLMFLFLWEEIISAQVVINEFSAKSSEWVELYNPTGSEINLSGWTIKDEKNSPITLSSTIPSHGFYVFEHASGWLNDDGDTIYLADSATPSAVQDSITYGSDDLISIPPSGKSAGRVPDGSSNWIVGLEISKGSKNPDTIQAPSSTPTKTPTPTHTPVPTHTTSPTHTPSPTHSPVPSKTPTPFSSAKPSAEPANPTPFSSAKPSAEPANPTPFSSAKPSAEPATPHLSSKLQDLRSSTPSGIVLSASAVQKSKNPSLPWGALTMIIVGAGMIGVSIFKLYLSHA